MNRRSKQRQRTDREVRSFFPPWVWMVLGGVLVAIVLAGGLWWYVTYYAPRWYVTPETDELWRAFLEEREDAPFRRVEVFPGSYEACRAPGVLITWGVPEGKAHAFEWGESEDTGFPEGYVRLVRDGAVPAGSVPLVVDVWMVFRRARQERLTRGDLAAGRGRVLVAGGTPRGRWSAGVQGARFGVGGEESVRTWLDAGVWARGSETAVWEDVWARFFAEQGLWVYAPLAEAVRLGPGKVGLLEADRFPDPAEVAEYELPVRVLWAVPVGWRNRGAVAQGRAWAGEREVQEALAMRTGLVPTVRGAEAPNPLAWRAKAAWDASTRLVVEGLH
ncbi:hypothetical protein Spith_0141 [Spirochaeta thermophila DSM 6578]|uniref:Uncharacterized protein n=1 Tax=Winmispira thermophila (strain ATCC 700085 / DSM 6578 / Z-1203) TaxID=869211 RepID=G0GC64_WINT7|nr:hypothetical protein [Spirochaeta thermophila]AEJ60428.1 hypothetical protein Spith_0141 [Spirochaeta thermophila DSM 6578]